LEADVLLLGVLVVGVELGLGFDCGFDFEGVFGFVVAGGFEAPPGVVLTSDTNSVAPLVTRVLAALAPDPPDPDPAPELALDELPSWAAVS
jgi:hypothetical protein